MGPQLKQVLRLLDQLPSAELERARNHASVRLKNGLAATGKATPADTFAHAALVIIADECHRRGVDVRASSKRLADNRAFPAFKAKMHDQGEIGGFLRKAARRSQIRLHALTRVGVNELIDGMLEMGWPVSAVTIMSNIHRIPAVLNQAFPGYAAAGLLHLVVREDDDARKE